MAERDIQMGPEDSRAFRDFLGPGWVDNAVRQAIQMCWHAMPKEKRTVAAVEAEIRRILDRALKDMREDAGAFGISEEPR